MTTVDKALADQIIQQDGYYADDPRVVGIIEYDNAWGGKGYKLIYKGVEPARRMEQMQRNPATRNPRWYWQAPASPPATQS